MTDSGTTKEMDLSAPIYSKPSPLGEVFLLIFAELHNKTIGTKKKKKKKTIKNKKLKLYIKNTPTLTMPAFWRVQMRKKKQPYNISLALSLCMSSP